MGFIKATVLLTPPTTDHRPTDHRPTDHLPLSHRPNDRLLLTEVEIEDQILNMFYIL